jgi:hypothetical protein
MLAHVSNNYLQGGSVFTLFVLAYYPKKHGEKCDFEIIVITQCGPWVSFDSEDYH